MQSHKQERMYMHDCMSYDSYYCIHLTINHTFFTLVGKGTFYNQV